MLTGSRRVASLAPGPDSALAKSKSRKRPARSQAQKDALRQKKHAASILRRAGLYKPKAPRITNQLVKNSRQLQRRLKEFDKVVRGEAKAHKIGKRRIVIEIKQGYQSYVRAGRVYEREVMQTGREAIERGRQVLDEAAQRLQEARDELARLRDVAPSIQSIEGPRFRDLQRRVASNPDSFLKILDFKKHKTELFNSRDRVEKDFSTFDDLLPDDWEDWFDDFPELSYYKEK